MTFLAYFGHLNLDITISVNNIASKGSAAARAINRQFGGTLGNFSMVASSLSLDFHPYSSVSETSHSEYLDFLRKRGVNISTIERMEDSEGPVCYIISDGKEQNAYMFQGPMDNWKPNVNFPETGYRYVHFSSGPPESYLKIAGKSKGNIVFDPSQELFYKYSDNQVQQFLDKCHILMGNRDEIEEIRDITGFDPLRAKFITVMTDGANGTVLYSNGEETRIGSPKPDAIVDTIGAGDAFRAGFYTALYRDHNMQDSVVFGNITASLAISGRIADFNISWSQIESRFRKIGKSLKN